MTDNVGWVDAGNPTFIKLFESTENFKLQDQQIMPLPFLLPVVATSGVAAWNGIVSAFNGVSGRTMQKNLEGQRLAHQ